MNMTDTTDPIDEMASIALAKYAVAINAMVEQARVFGVPEAAPLDSRHARAAKIHCRARGNDDRSTRGVR